MIVKVLGQGAGAATADPGTRASGQPPAGRAAASRAAPGAPPALSSSAADSSASEELFDANGDGTIENWSVLHGGDSFTTFDPPPPGTDTTRAPRSDSVLQATNRFRPGDAGHAGTPAAIHHAHSAYRRDGLAGAPAARDAAPPGNARTPAAPAAPVPRSGGGAALPSSK